MSNNGEAQNRGCDRKWNRRLTVTGKPGPEYDDDQKKQRTRPNEATVEPLQIQEFTGGRFKTLSIGLRRVLSLNEEQLVALDVVDGEGMLVPTVSCRFHARFMPSSPSPAH